MNAFRFRIPLTASLVLKGNTYSHREGVLIEQHGHWAEASPLPGFSAETIDDVIDSLRGNRSAPSSLRFAYSSLEQPITDTLEVPWNFLLLGNRKEVLDGVDRCIESQCQAVKLKVGRNLVQSEIELVQEVRGRLPSNVKLRLDANQAWSMEEAIAFTKPISEIDVEYIEEPLRDADLLERLFSETGVPYALDETLLRNEPLDKWPNVAALICKPTILGGRETIQRLAASGKPVVFSAAFESGVGISRIVQLAHEFSPTLAAGLDTLDWLSTDLLLRPVRKNAESFSVCEPVVDVDQLERIEL